MVCKTVPDFFLQVLSSRKTPSLHTLKVRNPSFSPYELAYISDINVESDPDFL